MRRVLALLLIAAFIFSISGCSSKSEYEKLMDQKDIAEKKITSLVGEKEDAKKSLSAKEMELKDKTNEIKNLNARIKDLESQLAKTKSELEALQKGGK